MYGETRSDDEFVEEQTVRRGNMKVVDASGAASSSKRKEAVEADKKATDSDGKKRLRKA
jgi:hypothetical protein